MPALTLTMHIETGCGVAAGPPDPLPEPIRNRTTWWYRLEHLIWGGTHEPPSELPFELSYEQAGALVDLAFEQAIAETGSIPGALPFVRTLLAVPDGERLRLEWESLLVEAPALDILLKHPYEQERVGVFSEPLFLSTFPGISQRGNRIHEALLNQSIPTEPAGRPSLGKAPVGATRRESMELVLGEPSCASCHQVMDPPGFAFERYDELGDLRTHDQGKPVETHGSFRVFPFGGTIEFEKHGDLGAQLASSCIVNFGFADRFLRYALEASRAAAIDLTVEHAHDSARMRQAFLSGGRSYRSLVKEFAQGPTLRSL